MFRKNVCLPRCLTHIKKRFVPLYLSVDRQTDVGQARKNVPCLPVGM